jgi:hypothetical protein
MTEFVALADDRKECGKITAHEIRDGLVYVWINWLRGGSSLVPLAALVPCDPSPVDVLAGVANQRKVTCPQAEFFRPSAP